ncbi:SDR family oxidoreductase [Arthrobacter sp. Soil764]|uniref:SDR family oxidoreductase n=1 Tax=Arthrobacter sp. Soil764 TaxID=1736403 RepID=UPI0006F8CF85|nr:SDR family oxidoreductase [Arthrobacter sp. Soil764]KRE82261.1 short-chain dehydrogenase [Arthrobacter sp. Soil764]
MRVKKAVVVITGASSGIGRATALEFADKGARLVLAARSAGALESLVHEVGKRGGRAVAVPTDVTDADSVDALAARAVEEFGRLDVWVNNAAVGVFGRITDVPLADFRRVLDVNIGGYVNGARAALPRFRAQRSGVLINVGSIVGEVSQPYTAAYSMSKAAVRALSVSIRSELQLDGNRKVKVCTVLPAAIDTPFFQHAANYTGRKVVAMPPVYAAERVARTIVSLAAKPRREAVVGPAGRLLVLQHKLTPAKVEGAMAVQVEKTHLSRKKPATASTGVLYEPSGHTRKAAVSGGWHGGRRTGRRRMVVATAAAGAAAVLWRRSR